MKSSMRNWMLGAAVAAAGFGLGAARAQAAEFGVHLRGAVVVAPPCPGPGYFWIDGYYAGGYWVPGRWEFRGVRGPAPFARYDGRGFDRREGRGFDRHDFRGHGRR